MIGIVPAIDIMGGRCVRLTKGDYGSTKVYDGRPEEMAARFAGCGVTRIHVVDLEGARNGAPANLASLERIARNADVEIEWGGGLCSEDSLESAFSAGATCATIGSVAALNPELFAGWLDRFGPSRMVLGADARNGRVSVKGWLEDTALSVESLVGSFLPHGISQCVCTDISRDGMLQGVDVEMYRTLQAKFPGVDFTVSGGISGMDDIRNLDAAGLRRVIVGKAYYEGRISLKDIEEWSQNA